MGIPGDWEKLFRHALLLALPLLALPLPAWKFQEPGFGARLDCSYVPRDLSAYVS